MKAGVRGTVSESFRAYVLSQLDELGDVTPRAMFGGVGLYAGGVFFGIVARDRLYLKVDAKNAPDYKAAGMKPFKPFPDRASTMKYYEVPVDVLESPVDLAVWARKAVDAAQRARSRPVRS